MQRVSSRDRRRDAGGSTAGRYRRLRGVGGTSRRAARRRRGRERPGRAGDGGRRVHLGRGLAAPGRQHRSGGPHPRDTPSGAQSHQPRRRPTPGRPPHIPPDNPGEAVKTRHGNPDTDAQQPADGPQDGLEEVATVAPSYGDPIAIAVWTPLAEMDLPGRYVVLPDGVPAGAVLDDTTARMFAEALTTAAGRCAG